MAEIDPKQFNDFQVDVLNSLESLQEKIATLTGHVVQVKTVLFGANGEPGKLATVDKRLDAHTAAIGRIKNVIWPMIGAIALLIWLGLSGLKQLLK